MSKATTGLPSLDEILKGLQVGDNVVWQIDRVEDYQAFVTPFVRQALADHKRVVYIRFGAHAPLVEGEGVKIYPLNAYRGFESFSREVHTIVTREGRGAYYVFDCLSDLVTAWATDQMIGNFFMVTCPYLFELDTIAYFAVERTRHSYKTIAHIRETTQLLLDLYNCEENYYLHPLKVWNRYTPTMFLPHMLQGERWMPITSSADTSKLFTHICKLPPESTRRNLDYWDLMFMEVEEIIRRAAPEAEQREMLDRLERVILSGDPRMLALCRRYFSLEDILAIKSRLVGTGFVGGKAVGMLLARNILLADPAGEWARSFEAHDSFFIGSDVFYTYIVQNGGWKLWMDQKNPEGYFTLAPELRAKLKKGRFPEEIIEQFQQVIEYFGQSPIIVRSSSLLEDSFDSAFAGKYESLFLANQGTPEERLERFTEAVREIYASTMSEEALTYRRQRGLDQSDEQMALLVQRVSGSNQGKYFFPFCAGVGVSYNTFVWGSDLDPKAGMLRLVLGLGTRAVNRVEGDYPRIVALDAPRLRPYAGMRDAMQYSQREVDVLDTAANTLTTVSLPALLKENPDIPLDLVGVRDHETTNRLRERGILDQDVWILTFDELLTRTDLVPRMTRLLKTLEETYQYPVDVEFTVNQTAEGALLINLLQCRPLQTRGVGKRVEIPKAIEPKRTLFAFAGRFAGGNLSQPIHRIIYVDPQAYAALNQTDKYTIARLVGKLNLLIPSAEVLPTMLIGPGRWGTSTPSLGVPASFSEINKTSVLVEVAFTSGNLMPELSFGTHFFQDLVETGIFYTAVYPEEPGVVYQPERFTRLPNRLAELVPEQAQFAEVVRVYDTAALELQVLADVVSQKIVAFFTAD
jgi:hypothetical protein